MEPVSLSLGIAALFTNCVQCFEYFKATTTMRKDYDILLLKLELEQERLLVWGEGVRIGEKDWSEEMTFDGDTNRQSLARRCLTTIGILLEDAEDLKSLYGVQPSTTATGNASTRSISSNALRRLRVRFARFSGGIGIVGKTRWAIHDAVKFQKLVNHIRDLIDGLIRDTVGAPEMHDKEVQNDIACMTDDISSLNLLSKACEDDYPSWSEVAKSAINASEIATTDGELANDRVHMYQIDRDEEASRSVSSDQVRPAWFGDGKFYIDTQTKIFFVLTEQCRNEGTDSFCDQANLGEMAFAYSNSFIAPGASYTGSSPGHWIAKEVYPQNFTTTDLKDWDEHQRTLEVRAIRERLPMPTRSMFLVNTYIYCPPCACQVETAFEICRSLKGNPNIDVRIRVDCRGTTSCSELSSRVDGMNSLIEYVKSLESVIASDDYRIERLRAIDRQWLEVAVDEYEEEVQALALPPSERISNIVRSHAEEELCAAIIILGEADHCLPLVRASPFPPFKRGRTPQETEIYKMTQNYADSNWYWQRNFMGTYARKPQIKKRLLPTLSKT